MKKTYNTPKAEISYFAAEDVITTSGKPEAYNELAKTVNSKNITIHDVELTF